MRIRHEAAVRRVGVDLPAPRDFLRRTSCLISNTTAYIEIKAAEINAGARAHLLK